MEQFSSVSFYRYFFIRPAFNRVTIGVGFIMRLCAHLPTLHVYYDPCAMDTVFVVLVQLALG